MSEQEILVALKNHPRLFVGICVALNSLYIEEEINEKEREQIFRLLYTYKDSSLQTGNFELEGSSWWWPMGEVEPRQRYLDYLIEKLKNEDETRRISSL